MKLVLLSGGVDSTTALALALSKDPQVEAVSFSYNQKHRELELAAATKIAQYYKVPHQMIDVATLFAGSHSSLNAANHMEVSTGDYANQIETHAANTEVEFRNGIFIAILASIAMQKGADEIYFGAHLDDSGVIYPDCSPEFIASMNETVQLGTGGKVRLSAPFGNMKKADIVRTGVALGVPYEMTYSCYNGVYPPCGKCGTCIDRQKAFKANGLEIL